MNPVAIRLLNQQLIVPQFKTPSEVVSHMGAMQAQEYRMMRWAWWSFGVLQLDETFTSSKTR